MALEFTTSYIADSITLLRYYKELGHQAMAQVSDEGLTVALDAESNSIAIIVKHLTGNMRSRWTGFLNSDGEKPNRNRDDEFREPPQTRAEIQQAWEASWKLVFEALAPLTDADLGRTIRIRNEAALRDAGDQSAACALRVPHWPDRLYRKASRIRPLDLANRTAWQIRRLQRPRRLWKGLAAVGPDRLLLPEMC